MNRGDPFYCRLTLSIALKYWHTFFCDVVLEVYNVSASIIDLAELFVSFLFSCVCDMVSDSVLIIKYVQSIIPIV